MSKHLSSHQIERYVGRTMSATELLETSSHIAECRSCRQLLSESEQIQSRVGSLRNHLISEAHSSAGHLSYEQVSAYVTGGSDDVESEVIESHIEVCSSCNEEVQDLRAFHAERSAAENVASSRPVSPFVSRFRWQRAFRIAFEFAAIAAAIILIVWLSTMPLRHRVAELRAQLAETQRKNDELQTQVSTTAESQPTASAPEQTESDSLARALYDSGRIIILDKQGNVTGMQSVPAQAQQAVKAVVNDPSGLSEELRGIVGRTGVLMGGSAEGVSFGLIGPVGTVVETDRPTFRWQPYPGATAYIVNVYDSGLKNVATSDRLSSTKWTASVPLKRGEVFTWQVTAVKEAVETTSPAPPAPEARFKILDQARLQEVSQFRNSYADSHLTLGALYKKVGLLDEAEREFEALLSANPHSVLARKLLEDLRAARRQ